MREDAREEDGRRSDKRLKLNLRVYYGPSQKTILSGFIVDLSSGGLFLQTEYPLGVGDHLSLIFSLPDFEKSVSCKARVAWANAGSNETSNDLPIGVGLQFLDLLLEDVVTIAKFVENYEVSAAW